MDSVQQACKGVVEQLSCSACAELLKALGSVEKEWADAL